MISARARTIQPDSSSSRLTSNAETRRLVLSGKSECELLGVVVNVLDLFELQRDEALVAAGKGLGRVGVSNVGLLGNVLLLIFGCGRAVDELAGGRRLCAAVVIVVAAACACSSGDTAVQKTITTALCSLGGVATDVLRMS